jgi:hypothetical protein
MECAGLLASRVRMSNPACQPAFPEISSDRRRFPRLQLRGSAGFAPASLSSPSGKDAHPKELFKEPAKLVQGMYAGNPPKVKSQCRVGSNAACTADAVPWRPSRSLLSALRGQAPHSNLCQCSLHGSRCSSATFAVSLSALRGQARQRSLRCNSSDRPRSPDRPIGRFPQNRNKYETFTKNCRLSLMNVSGVVSKPFGRGSNRRSRFCRLLLYPT